MFERFTERARQVVVLAQDEARHHESSEIRPEHILCGLFREEEGTAAKILTENFKLRYLDAQKLLGNDGFKGNGQIPFSDSGKKTFEYALREALSLGDNYISTEHILLGVCRGAVSAERGSGKVNHFFVHELKLPDSHNWPEIIRREVEEYLHKGKRARQIPKDLTPEENEEIDAREIVADLITGIQMWRSMKDEELDDADEMLIRWVAGSKANDSI